MISCDPNDLIALSACIDAKIPPGMQGAVQIYLLQQITGNTMTIEELMGAAACFNAKIPAGDHPGIQTWLLCQIANGNGGGGGSPGNLVFSAANIDRMDFLTDDLDTALSFPGLVQVSNIFHVQAFANLVSFSAPALATMLNDCAITLCPLLQTVDLSGLVNIGSDLDIQLNPVLASINLSSLSVCGGGLLINDCPSLVAFNLPVCTTISGGFVGFNCTSLTTFTSPLWNVTDGTTIDFTNCALSASSVEGILRRCVLSGVTTCTINLNGGTNAGTASLNAQGQADVVTLGGQLTINP